VVEQAAELGRKVRKRLDEFYEEFEVIGEVRGKGPMVAMELVKDRKTKEPDKDAAGKVMKECLESGLLTLKAGLYSNCIRLHPPLTIGDDLLEKGLNIMEEAFKKV
jgi:4-aminobutyrate aminotransferase/(S)-3-amino-2-methylpropionate transaminase